jgi:hypothetical protein
MKSVKDRLLKRLINLPSWAMPPFDQRVTLQVEELDKASVETTNRRSRPLPGSAEVMEFNAWRMAHAVKKADCLRWQSAHFLGLKTAGFLLENACLFDWQADDLRLNSGAAKELADFSRTSLAGRVGQGMAVLFLEEKDFSYVGRFESEWQKRATAQNGSGPVGNPKQPDFIAENRQKQWVLAESKGSFASCGGKTSVKGYLKKGLNQLRGWTECITPQPIKSFAIATVLRETGDPSPDPSKISFVDPEPETPSNPVEFPADAVRRANYASWLAIMGFEDASRRLLARGGKARQRRVQVLTLAGRQYAVHVASVSLQSPDGFSEAPDLLSAHAGFPWFGNGLRIEIIGLDLSVLKTISATLTSPTHNGLMDLQPGDSSELQAKETGEAFYGSVFADGSLVGELRLSAHHLGYSRFERETVELAL